MGEGAQEVRSLDFSGFDIVVIGSGFFGATIAERAADALDLKVCVLERRAHVGGNSHSLRDDETGIEYHKYGSHLFHTNSEEVWAYLHRFTKFTDYRHHVFTLHKGQVYAMPINLGTICAFFGRFFRPDEAKKLLAKQIATERIVRPDNLEEKAIGLIGRPLYEAFIRGYTQKQWQTDPRRLPAEIITRLPVRYNFESRYFSDTFEGLPIDGYAPIFERMLRHPNIRVVTGIDYFDARPQLRADQLLVYTGPIDRFFEHRAGVLGWRTLDFERRVEPVDDYQGTSVMNYADEDVPFTRVHEFKHLHPERRYPLGKTLVFFEYSRFAGERDEPYYPINTDRDKATYDVYRRLATGLSNVVFGGRLGSYRYLDMHQAIGAALRSFETKVRPFFEGMRSTGNGSLCNEVQRGS